MKAKITLSMPDYWDSLSLSPFLSLNMARYDLERAYDWRKVHTKRSYVYCQIVRMVLYLRFGSSLETHHYGDVIMGTIASQTTSLTIVYSTVYSDADQRKHQSSPSLPFVWGIHRGPVNSPHQWPITRKMFPFDDVIMTLRHTAIHTWAYSHPSPYRYEKTTGLDINHRTTGKFLSPQDLKHTMDVAILGYHIAKKGIRKARTNYTTYHIGIMEVTLHWYTCILLHPTILW